VIKLIIRFLSDHFENDSKYNTKPKLSLSDSGGVFVVLNLVKSSFQLMLLEPTGTLFCSLIGGG
jgi:hypothetical protein